jgi:hypothetical protein
MYGKRQILPRTSVGQYIVTELAGVLAATERCKQYKRATAAVRLVRRVLINDEDCRNVFDFLDIVMQEFKVPRNKALSRRARAEFYAAREVLKKQLDDMALKTVTEPLVGLPDGSVPDTEDHVRGHLAMPPFYESEESAATAGTQNLERGEGAVMPDLLPEQFAQPVSGSRETL